jgi:hypothetical protein
MSSASGERILAKAEDVVQRRRDNLRRYAILLDREIANYIELGTNKMPHMLEKERAKFYRNYSYEVLFSKFS